MNYKNQPLVEDFESGFFPSPGQIVLMGRIGGANEVHHIDNLTLKTELANVPVITGLQATADGFSVLSVMSKVFLSSPIRSHCSGWSGWIRRC